MKILILTALTRELVPIQNHLLSVYNKCPAISLNFKKIPVGGSFDSRAIKAGLSLDICINTGTAGAISKDLQPLEVFFPSLFFYDNRRAISFQNAKLLVRLMPEEWKTGTLFTSKEPVLSSKRKNEIANNYQAHAVDMEAYTIAEACAVESIPFLSLKVISDKADSNTVTIFKQNLNKAVEILSRQLVVLIDILADNKKVLVPHG